MKINASALVAVWSLISACESQGRDGIAVESNDLGITEVEVRRDRVHDDRLLTLRGLDETGATVATAVLRTGMVSYGADMPEALHAGTELELTLGDATASFVSPDRVPHVIYEPLSPRVATFVSLHAVATEIDREAGIRFAPPQTTAPSDELALIAQACDASRFPVSIGGAAQCCQDTSNTYHVNAGGAVVNRSTYAPSFPTIPICRKSNGTTGCTSDCAYGPCGSAITSIKPGAGHIFHPTSNPNVCGWDTGGAGGLGVDYSPEHYAAQSLYGGVTPSCGCTGCNTDGTPTPAGCCTPETNTQFCSRLGAQCGSVTAVDNCGVSRTVSSCGTCNSGYSCAGEGTPNVCGQTVTYTLANSGSGTTLAGADACVAQNGICDGTMWDLFIYGSPSEKWSYLKITLPSGGMVTGVTFSFLPRFPSSSGAAIYSVSSNSWTESGITWSNKPASAPTSLASIPNFNNINTRYNFDVSSFATTAGSTYSFAIKATSSNTNGSFYSKEYGQSGSRPNIIVKRRQ